MGSFRKRLLVLIIGLVVVTQTVTLAAVLARTAHNVEARAAEQLRSGGSFAQQLIRFRAGELANGVGVLAADFGFREAVASGDGPTIVSAAGNAAQRIGADLTLLLDTQGKAIVATGQEGVARGLSLQEVLPELTAQRNTPTFLVLGNQAYQFFLAPVRAPETIAWVAMGFRLDERLAQRIHDLVGAEVSLAARGRDGSIRYASTLSDSERLAAGTTQLAGASRAGTASSPARVSHSGRPEHLSFTQGLEGHGDPVDVIVQKPMQQVLAPYRDVRDALLVIDGIALAFAAIIGAFLGRSATRPIGELVVAAQRIQSGHYNTAVEVSGGAEFRSLAATFNSMQRNIAEREADITHQAHHDALTGLPNRTLAQKRLEELIGGAAGAPAALILIEIRNLREINASLGHRVGDEVLCEAARRLRANVPAQDLVARLGESQFLLLAGHCSRARAPLYAEQLASAIRAGFHLSQLSLELRVAAGVCLYPEHGTQSDQLLRRAQTAIEDVDESRMRVAMYRPGGDEEHRRRLTLLADLREAINKDELTMVYQPKVAMDTRSVRSVEALVRWTHPQLGAVGPGEFIPLAERSGGARRLTSWVLAAAIQQLGAWQQEGLEIEVAVNLSAPDILDPELCDEVLQLLQRYRVNAPSLLLEITESAVMRDPQLAARNMQLLRILGVRFAMDDFGTGHSSLSQLRLLPLDELKIDRSFVMQTHAGSDAATIIRSTIELAHSMELKVVAEGVEEAQAWDLLRKFGCDYAQGYLISKPLPGSEVPEFVRRANQLLPASDSTVKQLRALELLAARGLR